MSQQPRTVDLTAGDWTASVALRGATLRALTHRGDDVVTTFPADGTPEHSQGATLAPWPNRLRAGRWSLDGQEHQVPVPEGKAFAIHGLVRQTAFDVVEAGADRVVLTTVVAAQPGWPGDLRLDVAYALDAEHGLLVEASAVNTSDVALPFGYGAHPYLVLRDRDTATLEIPADAYLTVDADLLPVSLEAVDGTAYDYRAPRALGALDTAFTRLARDDEGTTRVLLADAGRTVEVWGDGSIGWMQVYTPGDGGSVAVEPMSCGPDAFNEPDFGAVVLQPGDGVAISWGIDVTI